MVNSSLLNGVDATVNYAAGWSSSFHLTTTQLVKDDWSEFYVTTTPGQTPTSISMTFATQPGLTGTVYIDSIAYTSTQAPVPTTPQLGVKYQLKAQNSGMCIDISSGAMTQQVCDTAGTNLGQQFYTELTGNGYFKIVSLLNGFVLDANTSTAGAQLVTTDWANLNEQQWRLTETANLSRIVTIQNKQTGQCVEVWNVSGAAGAIIDQYWCWNGGNQQFQLVEIPAAQQMVRSGDFEEGQALALAATNAPQQPPWTATPAPGVTSWTNGFTINHVGRHQGRYHGHCDAKTAANQTVTTLVPGANYNVTFSAKNGAKFTVDDGGTTPVVFGSQTAGTAWQPYSIKFTMPAGKSQAHLWFTSGDVDDVSMTAF